MNSKGVNLKLLGVSEYTLISGQSGAIIPPLSDEFTSAYKLMISLTLSCSSTASDSGQLISFVDDRDTFKNSLKYG